MANSKYIGLLTCPHCASEIATVHEQQTGNKKGRKYYRCYTEINGTVQKCGTVQCIGPDGQAFIEKNIRPIDQEPPKPPPEPEPMPVPDQPIGQTEPEPEPIGQPEPELPPEESPPERPKRSIASLLIGDDWRDE